MTRVGLGQPLPDPDRRGAGAWTRLRSSLHGHRAQLDEDGHCVEVEAVRLYEISFDFQDVNALYRPYLAGGRDLLPVRHSLGRRC